MNQWAELVQGVPQQYPLPGPQGGSGLPSGMGLLSTQGPQFSSEVSHSLQLHFLFFLNTCSSDLSD